MTKPTLSAHRTLAALPARLTVALFVASAWLRGEQPTEDRGSDSSEKSWMIFLAVTIGAAVFAAGVALIATLDGKF